MKSVDELSEIPVFYAKYVAPHERVVFLNDYSNLMAHARKLEHLLEQATNTLIKDIK